jgi:Ca-activated chloride channel homolog
MSCKSFIGAVLVAGTVLFGGSSLIGQTAKPTPEDTIRVDTVLISIPVVVTDKSGRHVGGLKKSDFSITLDGQKQEIEYFADNDMPLTVAIVVDNSGSTAPFLKGIKEAGKAFIDQLTPQDRAMVVVFNQQTIIACPLTSDKEKAKKKLAEVNTDVPVLGLTDIGRPASNMYDAVYDVARKHLAGIRGRKAIIVLTDGFVRRTVSDEDFSTALFTGDTVVYPMMFLTKQHLPANRKGVSALDLLASPPFSWMNWIASGTGGRLLITGGRNDFNSAFQQVTDELRKQYVVGFYPTLGQVRPKQILLGVNRPGLSTRTKTTVRLKFRAPSPTLSF